MGKETFRADLHCHTLCSDGSDTPEEVIRKAAAAQLQGLSITDHDSIAAYTPEVFALGRALSLRLLPGVELSSELDHSSVHVLGYGIDLSSNGLAAFLRLVNERRGERNRAILAKLNKRGFPLEEAELIQHVARLHGHRTIGRPHIAELMVAKGYIDSVRSAFEQFLRDDACCYAPGIKCTPLEVIDQIHAARGKAILAHPHFIQKRSHLNRLLALPLDGIECYYGVLHKEQEREWIDLAKARGWIATGGSDYHGAAKPHISLGCSWVDEETFEKLGQQS